MFRQGSRSELACDENDDLVGTNASGRELSEYETENKRSRLGWGITHMDNPYLNYRNEAKYRRIH